jgi:cell division protein FtsB
LRIRFIVGTIVLVGAAYFAVLGGEYGLLDLHRVRAERDVEAARLDSARSDVATLRARADSLERDSATIERLARERYGLIRPGERLFRIAERPAATRDSAADSSAVQPAAADHQP